MTKRLLLTALVLFAPWFAYADGGCANDVATRVQSNVLSPIASASVLVCTNATCNVHATLYQDSTLGVTIANPVTADARGNYSFCAAPGQYTVKVTNPANATTYTVPQVTVPVALDGVLSVKSINGIRYADNYAGANAGAKITAAIADLPSGGLVDARGFGATTQSISSQITVPADTALLFDPATKFQASTSALNIFKVQKDGVVKGFRFDCGNQPAYTGILFQNDSTQFYGDGNKTEIADVGTTNCGAVTGFTALKLLSPSVNQGVAFLKVHGWRIYGGADGIFMTTAADGFVNGNHFSDMQFSNQAHGWHITGVAGGAIEGNVCGTCAYEKSTSGTNGVLIDGASGTIDGNLWVGPMWDTTVPISITNTVARKNTFIGYVNGTVSDATNLNNIHNIANASTPSIQSVGVQVKHEGGAADKSQTLDLFDITAAAPTPHKYFRVNSGLLQIMDSAYANDVVVITDAGFINAKGGLSANNAGVANAGPISGATTMAASGLTSLTGGFKAGASGSTISDTRELVQSVHDCGTTTTCANTANLSERMVRGAVALSSATPSTAVVTGMTAFGGNTAAFYSCWLTNETTQANPVKYVRTSSSSITITGPNTVTDVISYLCVGH